MEQTLIYQYVLFIGIAIGTASLIRKHIFFLTRVSSYSMVPTLQPKDLLFTLRIHDFQTIRRGDILVFYSDELQDTLVKRVIGLPEDVVSIDDDGAVSVNQTELDEPYVDYPSRSDGRFEVPPNNYLFLGDNRAASHDSRSFADPFIHEGKIRGKVLFSIFPFHLL
ncbi:peptidase s26a signal peptidase i serine active site [Trichococcus palustris]|jgi:signal peptidase I|uniref:Signal peptidase I n=1 Tax=Trichococcus palustris TaxID=140314 RepID=A0A143YV11_9LACT|nr:signal peptidase I [Trichococcus palustris]CZQ99495.1 peptidase s26a signal peptidase i serine active site [Trichococcus palustris]SFK87526.1 signal peptidase I [Trichococcus palustris]